MKASDALNRDRWYATIVIVIAGVAWIIGSHLPSQRVWGFNHLAFLPEPGRLVLGIALAVALAAIWSVPARFPRTNEDKLHIEILLAPVLVIGWMMTLILAHTATPLLGDGYLRGDEVERLLPGGFGIAEFLPGWLASTLYEGMRSKANVSGTNILAGLSVAAGLLFVGGAVLLWTRAVAKKSSSSEISSPSLLSVFWLLTAGSSVLYFGYVESYGLALAFLSLFTLAHLAHRSGRLPWGWVVALWIAALWSHLAALAWAPALFWGLYERRKRNLPWGLPAGVTLGALVISLTILRWGIPVSPTVLWSDLFLPLVGSPYSVVHWRHLADMINHAILVLPASLLLTTTRPSWRPSIILLWLPTVAFLLFFNPKLGWWRDWDLFALVSAPTVVLLATALARQASKWPLPRRTAAIALASISFGLWLWVNVSEPASTGRVDALLTIDPDRTLSGYENLARYWREKGYWEESARVLDRALQTRTHARLSTQQGIAWSAARQWDAALESFKEAIVADSLAADGYFGAGQVLWINQRPTEALPYVQRAVALDSSRADYRYQLGLVLRDIGDLTAALPHLAYASSRAPGQPMYANAYAAALFEAGDDTNATATLRATLERHPQFSLAYANLGWVLYQTGDTRGSEAALNKYELQVHPQERIPLALQLRQSLDSLKSESASETE